MLYCSIHDICAPTFFCHCSISLSLLVCSMKIDRFSYVCFATGIDIIIQAQEIKDKTMLLYPVMQREDFEWFSCVRPFFSRSFIFISIRYVFIFFMWISKMQKAYRFRCEMLIYILGKFSLAKVEQQCESSMSYISIVFRCYFVNLRQFSTNICCYFGLTFCLRKKNN